MRRGRGRPMPGGPGKGRGRMQQPMPQINFGQGSMPMPTPRTQGPSSISSSPLMIQQGLGETGRFGQLMDNRPVQPLDFGQITTQGPMNMPPMDFPQPTARPVNQTMGRPMPQPNFTLGPIMNQFAPQNRGGFYSGGITDLY